MRDSSTIIMLCFCERTKLLCVHIHCPSQMMDMILVYPALPHLLTLWSTHWVQQDHLQKKYFLFSVAISYILRKTCKKLCMASLLIDDGASFQVDGLFSMLTGSWLSNTEVVSKWILQGFRILYNELHIFMVKPFMFNSHEDWPLHARIKFLLLCYNILKLYPTHTQGWSDVTGRSRGESSITPKIAWQTCFLYSMTSGTLGHWKDPPNL